MRLLALLVLLALISHTVAYPQYNGFFDTMENGLARGWAYEASLGKAPSHVDIHIDNVLWSTVMANFSRPDIVPAGAPNAEHGFQVKLPQEKISTNTRIDVYMVCSDGSRWSLYNSPRMTDPLGRGLETPQGVQGLDDQTMMDYVLANEPNAVPLRMSKIKSDLKPGIRRYNLFWSAVESKVPSQAAPFQCPGGYQLTPLNEKDRIARGYFKYHCYSTATLEHFDKLFELDKAIGAINAGIIYSAPSFYRYENCTGFPWGDGMFKGGCVPRADAMDDWSDYLNLLAERYNGGPSSPHKLAHYIIWNEVASSGWMDYSPILRNRYNGSDFTPAEMNTLTGKYADMMKRASAAVRRHMRGAMIWISTDRLWEKPHLKIGAVGHHGTHRFMDFLWPQLGISIDWAVAVHPYDSGDPRADQSKQGMYTFDTLDKMVLAYQHSQLSAVAKVSERGFSARPQVMMYASEQGWARSATMNDVLRARNICYAHALALKQNLFAVTHNYFHASPTSNTQNGQDFGLIPKTINGNLTNADGYPTWEAYKSTAPDVFYKDSSHYCCTKWQTGCKS